MKGQCDVSGQADIRRIKIYKNEKSPDSLDSSKQPLSETAVGNVTATSLFNWESGRSCYNVTHRCPSTSSPIPGCLSGAVD